MEMTVPQMGYATRRKQNDASSRNMETERASRSSSRFHTDGQERVAGASEDLTPRLLAHRGSIFGHVVAKTKTLAFPDHAKLSKLPNRTRSASSGWDGMAQPSWARSCFWGQADPTSDIADQTDLLVVPSAGKHHPLQTAWHRHFPHADPSRDGCHPKGLRDEGRNLQSRAPPERSKPIGMSLCHAVPPLPPEARRPTR